MGLFHATCYGPPGCNWKEEASHEPFDLNVVSALGSAAWGLKKRGRTWTSAWLVEHELRMEELLLELFRLHDLDGNGELEEAELIRLNEQIAILHYGEKADLRHVREKYRGLFRTSLDPDGGPVSCDAFCSYTRKVLDSVDHDPVAQEMILEQWSAEAQACRDIFAPGRPQPAVRLHQLQGQLRQPCSSPPQPSQPAEQGSPKQPSDCSDHELTSTADESLAETGADSDSDTNPACGASGASGSSQLGGRWSRVTDTDEDEEPPSLAGAREVAQKRRRALISEPETGADSPVMHI